MGGGSEEFFWSEILAKRYFFGSMKDAGIFGSPKKHRDFLGYCTFHKLKSTITEVQFTAGVEFFWVC